MSKEFTARFQAKEWHFLEGLSLEPDLDEIDPLEFQAADSC